MAWHRINYGCAESDSGARVTRTGFRTLKYQRGDRELTIDVETGDKNLGVYARSVNQWQDGSHIGDAERSEILEDVKAALQILRVPFELLWN